MWPTLRLERLLLSQLMRPAVELDGSTVRLDFQPDTIRFQTYKENVLVPSKHIELQNTERLMASLMYLLVGWRST